MSSERREDGERVTLRTTSDDPDPDRRPAERSVSAAGEWRVIRELGRGGMGVVYEVERGGVRRALKQLISADAEQLMRFEREARAMARLAGASSVVRIHETGVGPAGPWFVMDLMAGGSLRDRLQREGVVDPREACRLMAAVAESLAVVHTAGIIHRDLKLENILLDEEGRPTLADFGLVRSDDERGLTRSVALLGTLGTMAPEQLEGQTDMVGSEADIWAVGVMLHELVVGLKPYEGINPPQLLNAIHSGRRSSSVQEAVAQPPRGLAALIDEALSLDPEQRPNAGELARRCREVAEAEVEPETRSRALFVGLAGIALITVIAVIGVSVALARQRRADEQSRRVRSARALVREVELALRNRMHERLSLWIRGPKSSATSAKSAKATDRLKSCRARLEALPDGLRRRDEVVALRAALSADAGEVREPSSSTGALEALVVLSVNRKPPRLARLESIARRDSTEPELVPLMAALRELDAGDVEAASAALDRARKPSGIARELIGAARDQIEAERIWASARRGDPEGLQKLIQSALKAPESDLARRLRARLARELGPDRPPADRRALLTTPALRWPHAGCQFLPRPLPEDLASEFCEDFVRSTYRASEPRIPLALDLARALSHAMPLIDAGRPVPEALRFEIIAKIVDKPGWEIFAPRFFRDSRTERERIEGFSWIVLGLARGGAWPRLHRPLRHALLPFFERRRGDPAHEPGATFWWLFSHSIGPPKVAAVSAEKRLDACRFLLAGNPSKALRGTILECQALAQYELAMPKGEPVKSKLREAVETLRESLRIGGGADPGRVAMRLPHLLRPLDLAKALAQCDASIRMLDEHLAMSASGRLAQGRSSLEGRAYLTAIEHEDRVQAVLMDKVNCLRAMERDEEALAVFNELLAMRHDQPERRAGILILKADVLITLKRFREARAAIETSAVLDAKNIQEARREAILRRLDELERGGGAPVDDAAEEPAGDR